ncbi:hypothetical protein AAMO2058_000350000 [Amorphochlora amoebiformis]
MDNTWSIYLAFTIAASSVDCYAGTVRLVRPFVSNQRFPSPSVHHNPALIPSSPLSSLSAPKWHESAIKVSTQASTSMFKPRRGLFQMVRKLKDWKQMLRMTLVNGVDGLRARDAFDGQVNRGNENVTVGEMREVERESLVASALGGGGGTESRLVDDPEGMVARWRRFTETKQFTTMLLMVYIMVDISVYALNGWSTKNHMKMTILVMQSAISFSIGTSIALIKKGRAGTRQVFDFRSWINLFPIAASFALSMGGQLAAFEYFAPPLVKILGQMKLPLSAILSVLMLKKEYTLLQWQAIAMVFMTVINFMSLKSGSSILAGDGSVPGLIAVGVWITFNCLATLLAERFYRGWNHTTVAVLIALVCDSWVSGLVVKRLSSVTKNMSKVGTLVTLYFMSLKHSPVIPNEVAAAFTVVQATLLFVYASQPSQGATSSRGLWTRLYDDPGKETLEKSKGKVVQRLKTNLENADWKTVRSLEGYLKNMGI